MSFVLSRLDYGAIIHTLASPSTVKVLDPIANEAMRLATGAFKSNPISF